MEDRRGTRQSRGYDKAFIAARKRWEPKVATGRVVCWRCEETIGAGDEWDLGHLDSGVIGGPEHRRTCNRRAAGLKSKGKAWTAPPSKELTDARARAERAAERRRKRLEGRNDGSEQ